MKKLVSMIIIFLTVFSMALTVLAIESVPEDTKKTTVKVGYFENYGVINSPSNISAKGFGYEYLSEIEKYTNYKFEYISTEWSEGMELLKQGKIDLFGIVSMNQERLDSVEFVESAVCYENAYIYAPLDAELYYHNPAALNGLTIGIAEDAAYREQLEEYIAENDLDLQIKVLDGINFMEYVEKGEIDIFVMGSLLQVEGVKVIEDLYSDPLYFISTKGNTELCKTMQQAIEEIEKKTPYFNELLWYKYYGNYEKALQDISKMERVALDKKRSYTVGYHTDLHPISYKGENGEAKGYAVDIMEVLANKLGIQVTYVPLHEEQQGEVKNLDFNLCPLNRQWGTQGRFSEPYYYQNLLVMSDIGVKKSEVKNILVQDYHTITIEECLELYPAATVHKSYSTKEDTDICKNVDIDCRIVLEGSEILVPNNENKNISVLDVTVPLGIKISDELPHEVVSAVNKMILTLKKGLVDQIILENALELKPKHTIQDFVNEYDWLIITVVLCIIGVYIYITWTNRKKMIHILEVDHLTGLMSRYKFEKVMKRVLLTGKPNEYQIIILDIDKFKIINKIYGIEKGDQLLCAVAKSLLRQSKENTPICRIHNDAFAMLTKNTEITSIPMDGIFEEQVRDLGIDIAIYFSLGVYVIGGVDENVGYILDCARIARAEGKMIFGNTVYYYTTELKNRYEKESMILSTMESAIVEDEFFILIQPKVELQSQKIVGGEVLVRWKKPDDSYIYPDEFIPLFEENDFIIKLDYYVLRKSCEFIQSARTVLPCISVNISATTMLEEKFITECMSILNNYELKPEQIELELTESVLDSDFRNISQKIAKLKEIGFSIAIDDFGKGASSLARIKELDMDVLKLDKEFIEDNTGNEKGKLVLHNIITMANDLGIVSLAEGIETENQRDLLVELGCELGQGYYFDRPLPLKQFLEKLIEHNIYK